MEFKLLIDAYRQHLEAFHKEIETTVGKGRKSPPLQTIRQNFGLKTIFFDPKDGKSASSRTLTGVINLIRQREDIENPDAVIESLSRQATQLVRRMENDGYIVPDFTLK